MESDDEVIIKALCGLSDVEVTDVEIEGGIAPVDSGDSDPDPDHDEWDGAPDPSSE